MSISQTNWLSPPSDSINRALRNYPEKTIRLFELGKSYGLDVMGVLTNRTKLDEQHANLIAEVVGSTTNFWRQRSLNYEQELSVKADAMEQNWIEEYFPTDALHFLELPFVLSEYGTTDKEKVLNFFSTGTTAELERLYLNKPDSAEFHASKSFKMKSGSAAIWIRSIEYAARTEPLHTDFDRDLLERKLPELRYLAKMKFAERFFPKLKAILRSCGVHLIYRPHPSGCPASAALIRRHSQAPIVAVTFRHRSDDQFWFSFFHEIGHLLDDDENHEEVDVWDGPSSEREFIADQFAESVLFDENFYKSLRSMPRSKRSVIRLAVKHGLTPGLVVSQMHRLGIMNYSWMQGLKARYSREVLTKLL